MDRSKPDSAASTPPPNPFDTMDGYSGQDYHRDREAELTRQHPGGEPMVHDGAAARPMDRSDDTPEAGRSASIDPATGEVRGSGSGAGGGNPGEDHDNDPKGGGGYPATGAPGEVDLARPND
jgi:hypothetical protein